MPIGSRTQFATPALTAPGRHRRNTLGIAEESHGRGPRRQEAFREQTETNGRRFLRATNYALLLLRRGGTADAAADTVVRPTWTTLIVVPVTEPFVASVLALLVTELALLPLHFSWSWHHLARRGRPSTLRRESPCHREGRARLRPVSVAPPTVPNPFIACPPPRPEHLQAVLSSQRQTTSGADAPRATASPPPSQPRRCLLPAARL